MNSEPSYQAPPYKLYIIPKKQVINARVTLHKIPEKCINFEPTPTHFHVDTLKYTKKLFLHIPYPYDVKVDPATVEAKIEYGVLTCQLPLMTSPQEVEKRMLNDKVEKRKLIEEELTKKDKKRKREDEGKVKKVKKVKTQPKLKVKNSIISKSNAKPKKLEKSVAPTAMDIDESGDNDKVVEPPTKKKKVLVEDPKIVLKIMDDASDKVEQELESRLAKVQEKAEKEAQREHTKEERKKLKVEKKKKFVEQLATTTTTTTATPVTLALKKKAEINVKKPSELKLNANPKATKKSKVHFK